MTSKKSDVCVYGNEPNIIPALPPPVIAFTAATTGAATLVPPKTIQPETPW